MDQGRFSGIYSILSLLGKKDHRFFLCQPQIRIDIGQVITFRNIVLLTEMGLEAGLFHQVTTHLALPGLAAVSSFVRLPPLVVDKRHVAEVARVAVFQPRGFKLKKKTTL